MPVTSKSKYEIYIDQKKLEIKILEQQHKIYDYCLSIGVPEHKGQYLSEITYPSIKQCWSFTKEQEVKLNQILEVRREYLRELGVFNSYAVIERNYDFSKEGQPGVPDYDREWKSSPYR